MPDTRKYRPGELPDYREPEAVVEKVYQELSEIAGIIDTLIEGRLPINYVAPTRPREGQIAYADGTKWDPGRGKGYYEFNGTDWKRLIADNQSTWTPFDNSGAGLALTVVRANYLQYGGLIIAQAQVNWPVTANVANATIGGFPVAAKGNNTGAIVSVAGASAIMLNHGSTNALLYTTAAANIKNNQLSGAGIAFTLAYLI